MSERKFTFRSIADYILLQRSEGSHLVLLSSPSLGTPMHGHGHARRHEDEHHEVTLLLTLLVMCAGAIASTAFPNRPE